MHGVPPPGSATPAAPALTEADLSNSLIGRVLSGAGLPLPAGDRPTTSRPFLTVLTRTQGRRPDTLRDAFACLTSQTCHDFEVLVVGHHLDPEKRALVDTVISELPGWMHDKVRFVECNRGNRTAPLNDGFAAARGRYVAILDDDDLVFAHWVETFAELGRANAGMVLRSRAVIQDYGAAHPQDATITNVAAGSPRCEFPEYFDLLEHLRMNHTPPVALAFPRAAFTDLGLRFDETLTTTEDWDYLLSVAFRCGVASSPDITGIWRQWLDRESSRTVHALEEWQRNHYRIFDKQDAEPIILPAGSALKLRSLLDEIDQLKSTIAERPVVEKIVQVAVAMNNDPGEQDQIASLAAKIDAIYDSRSWRLMAPLRYIGRLFGRKRPVRIDTKSVSKYVLKQTLYALENSLSWQFTAPLRAIMARL